ncbi:MAG: phage minor capsid protein [Acutalibacteraceae bacterium]
MAHLTYEQALAKLYTKAEAKLIETIKHKVAHGNATAYERSLLKQVNEQIQALRKSSDILVQQLVKNSYKQGLDALLQDIASDPVAPQAYNLMSGLNTNQINIIVDNITSQLNQAIATVGRRCNDYIRQTALSATAKKLTTGQTVRQMQRELEANLEKANITSIEYSNGVQHKIKDYASMVARTTTAETQNTAQRIQGKAWGYDLVIMTTHYPTCEVCAMYQGRVYATTKEASNGKYKDKNGNPLLFPYIYDTVFVDGYDTVHPNCRHRFAVFPPNAYTLDELAEFSRQSMQPFVDNRSDEERKAYATEQAIKRKRNESRRQYEQIKSYLPDQAPKTFSGWQRMKSANSQRYHDLMDDYKTIRNIISSKEKNLLNEQSIISQKDVSNGYSVNRKLVNSKQYHDKFSSLPISKNVYESAYKECGRLLEFSDGKPNEHMIAINARNGNLVTDNMARHGELTRTSFNEDEYNKILACKDGVVLMHNHSTSVRPSGTDIKTFATDDNIKMSLIACHDGDVYAIMSAKKDVIKLYDDAYNTLRKTHNEDTAKALVTQLLYSKNETGNLFDLRRL